MKPEVSVMKDLSVELEPSSVGLWHEVCSLAQLQPERGVAVIVGGHPVALFQLSVQGETSVFAVSHIDPRTETPTIARGLVGSSGGDPIVVAPLLKDRFSLRSGVCLNDPDLSLEVFDVRLADGSVFVRRNVTVEKHV